MLNEKLKPLSCEIQDIKLVESGFEKFSIKLLEHINYRTYFRYVIPEVVEEKRALYLDVDLIVNDDITHLFNIDLEGKYVAAVKEKDSESGFNAGMILYDIEKCKADNITQKLVNVTNDTSRYFPFADQSVLNDVFPDYKVLSRMYNWQPELGYNGYQEYKDCNEKPKIIHYSTERKPWKPWISDGEFRDLWWHYHALDWQYIYALSNKTKTPDRFSSISKIKIFILTNSAELENIEFLVENIPEYQFNIAAYTSMAPSLKNLSAKDNVFIYPNADRNQVDSLLKNCHFYLDINAYDEVDDIVERAKRLEKKVLAFDNTKHREVDFYDAVILKTKPEEMVKKLKQL